MSTTPITLLLFGITGNLSLKKIIPSWWYLYTHHLLPESWKIIGVGRRTLAQNDVAKMIEGSLTVDSSFEGDKLFQSFLSNITYISGDVRSDATYDQIVTSLQQEPTSALLVYVSTFPNVYEDVITQLARFKVLRDTHRPWSRLLIEKPFGLDTDSSKRLNTLLAQELPENEIYRIDHYLAKETVQNILAFRFANGVFEHMWNSNHIERIELTYAESGGIEGREEFFNTVGIVRDVVQNHVMQLLSIVLMDEPDSLSPQAIQKERLRVLSDFHVLSSKEVHEQVHFGQYVDSGLLSSVATAVAATFSVENERWRGMPIHVRAGKKFKTNVIEAQIIFKEPQNKMFASKGLQKGNILTLRIQPNEGIALSLNLKRPGLHFEMETVPMSFCYRSGFATLSLVEAYSKVLFDAIEGDSSLFLDADGTDACWRVVEPLLECQSPHPMEIYDHYSWGPTGFSEILPANSEWLEPDLSTCSI